MNKQFNWQEAFTAWAYCGRPSQSAEASASGWQYCALGEKYGLGELTPSRARDFVYSECSSDERFLGGRFWDEIIRNNLSKAIDIYNKIQALPKVDCDPLDYLNYEGDE